MQEYFIWPSRREFHACRYHLLVVDDFADCIKTMVYGIPFEPFEPFARDGLGQQIYSEQFKCALESILCSHADRAKWKLTKVIGASNEA